MLREALAAGHPVGVQPVLGALPSLLYIYIYIYRERERDMHIYIYTYIYTHIHIYVHTRAAWLQWKQTDKDSETDNLVDNNTYTYETVMNYMFLDGTKALCRAFCYFVVYCCLLLCICCGFLCYVCY